MTLVWVAMALVAFVGFVALAVDWGYAYYNTQKLQNAADAAALAGAQRVWFSQSEARDLAMARAASNEVGGDPVLLDENPSNAPDGDIVTGVYDDDTRTFTPSTDYLVTNAVLVNARRTADSPSGALPLAWGTIFGIDSAQFSRWAIAVAVGGPNYADLIALNPDEPQSFYVYGNAYLDLGDGSAQVNSSHLDGTMYQGTHIDFIAGEVNMVATDYETRGRPDLAAIDMKTEQPYVADPLASVPEPVAGSPMMPSKITGIAEFHPGYYPGGIDLKDADNVFLHPGVYILDTGFYINGHASLTGWGVMFFLRNGTVHDNGTGDVRVTPPMADNLSTTDVDESVYKGIQFFQARDNTEMATFNGGTIWNGAATDDPSTPDIDESTAGSGTLYFPVAKLELGGTGTMYVDGIIADQIHVYGTGQKHVTGGYDGDDGGDKVYLVE